MLPKFRQDYPKFKFLFQFDQFNTVQKQCYPKIFNYSDNMIVSAPTSSGKTVLFELLIAKLMNEKKTKCLYLAPIKSLCHEKCHSWRKKFMTTMNVMELTGDTLQMEPGQFSNADIYIATPEKIDYISRKNLNFLKELNLLLIDQIHMLNMEDRGAILEAIVSRIMSINKKIRIMAVSATIPNIKQVAQWLKVPPHLICVFGEQYRPAKLHKVVLGFKAANNDFNFEKMLNFKILDVIRHYSFGRGALIFCQTQKGTEEACSKLISQANQRQFVANQQMSMELVNSSKSIDNFTLKSFLPHGVAFHNASLSMKDRSIVEGLFLDLKIQVLCTTSTLSMGINLPARLVIIKSTKCYKGSGKGYQQYTQIQLDQMMGRAGRIPFDKQGTVVIMTQKSNYNKYMGDNKLQNLQSQLYHQFIDHLNTEISLRSIQTFNEAIEYFKNSFCYIRMQTSPKLYNLQSKGQVEKFVADTCIKQIKKLAQYEIIQYVESNEKIFPRQCSNNLSRNAIEVQTIIRVIDRLNDLKTQRQCLNLLCNANQLTKYRSKLDQRKFLKDLNERNRYTMKQTISTYQKKCFVLVQAQLSGIHIDNWQLRKQASQMIYFFKRLAYCVKCLAVERKNVAKTFWLYLYSCLFHKYFSQGFWEQNQQKVLKQIRKVSSKWKNISARGIRSLSDLTYGLSKLDIFGNGMSSAAIKKGIQDEINLLNGSLQIITKKVQDNNQNQSSTSIKQSNHLIKFIFTKNFDERFKSIQVIVEHKGQIYHTGYLNTEILQFSVFLKNTLNQKYFIAILKQGFIGFDEFYWFQMGILKKTQLKRQQNQKKLIKSQSLDLKNLNKISQNFIDDDQEENSQKKIRSNSLSSSLKRKPKNKQNKNKQKIIPKQINFIHNQQYNSLQINQFEKNNQNSNHDQIYNTQAQNKLKWNNQERPQQFSNTMKINKKSKQLKLTENFSTIKRKHIYDEQAEQKRKQDNPLGKSLKKSTGFRDIKSYNWKPGFEQIKDYEDNSYNSENKYLSDEYNTSSGQKQRKLLLSNDQQQSDEQFTQKQIKNNNKNGKTNIINELNEYMVNKYKNPIINKISRNSNISQKGIIKESNNNVYDNNKNNTYQIKYIPQKQINSPQTINPIVKQAPKSSSRLFLQQLRKHKQPQINKCIKQKQNNQKSRKVPFLNRNIIFQQDKSKQKKIINPFNAGRNQMKFINIENERSKNKVVKKEYKNAYEYFQSFLSDQQDESN